ncbi:MAG: protein kinase, partial [Streptosporangiaceae bacterium]
MLEPLAADDPTYAGSYRLVELLGAGGHARVFLGQDQSGRQVAVRLFAEGTRFRPGHAAELKAFQAAPTGLLDAGDDLGRPYLVGEYAHGETLAARLGRQGTLEEAELRRTCGQTMDALAAAHGAGLAHGDLKPSKVLIAEDRIRLIGFGLALVDVPAQGPYLSPEQARGGPGDLRSDLFSWACVMVEAGTGQRPFPAEGRAVLMTKPQLTGIAEPLKALFASCLAKDPALRPTAKEAAGALADRPVAPEERLPSGELLELAEACADEQERAYDPARGLKVEELADLVAERDGPSRRIQALRDRAHAAPV